MSFIICLKCQDCRAVLDWTDLKSYVTEASHLSNFDDLLVLFAETDAPGDIDRLGFATSDSSVDKSALYKMEENTLQKICNFRGRIKNSIKLASNSILDTN